MTPNRVFQDSEGDLWFEVTPDRFVCASNRECADQVSPWLRARLRSVSLVYGPLTPKGIE